MTMSNISTSGGPSKLAKWLSCCEYLSVWCIWLHAIVLPCTRFRVNLPSILAGMSTNSLLKTGPLYEVYDSNGIQTHKHLAHKQSFNHLAKLAKWLSCVVSNSLYGAFESTLLSCHVHVSTHTSLNIKELLPWSLSIDQWEIPSSISLNELYILLIFTLCFSLLR